MDYEEMSREELIQEVISLRSGDMFRILRETIAAAIFIFQGTAMKYVNSAAVKLTGYSEKELLSRDFWEIIHPDFQEMVKRRGTERQRGAEIPSRYEVKIITKSGEERWLDFRGTRFEYRGKPAVLGTAFDITEQKQMEILLRKAEERYRVLYENVPSMYFTLTPEGTIISVNEFGASELGYNVKELIGQSVLKVFQKQDASTVLDQLKICVEEPYKVHEWQIQKIRKDGTVLWVEEFARMVDGLDGRPNILIVCQDITRRKLIEDTLQEDKENLESRVKERTAELINANIFLQSEISERKQVEDALRESRERLETLMEKIPNGVGVVTPEGKITYCNPALLSMSEFTEAEIKKAKLSKLIHLEDRKRLLEKIQHLFEGGSEYVSEYRVISKSGKTIPVEVYSRRIFYDGNPVILSVISDISSRKQAEAALKMSEERYRTLIEQAGDGIFVADENGRHLIANTAGCNMLGYSLKEILQLNVRDLYLPEDLKKTPPDFEVLKKGESVTREIRLKRKDGTHCAVEATAKSLPDGRIQAIVRDITGRKRAQEQLEKERDRAQKYLDIAGVIFVVLNVDQKVNLINKRGCEILEYKESEIIGKNWFDNFVPERHRSNVRTGFEKLMAGNVKSMEYFENPVVTKSGTEKMIAWHNTVLTDENNCIIGTLSSGENITERKLVEEELKKHRIHLEELVAQRTAKLQSANRKLRKEIQVRKHAEKELKQSREQIRKLSAHRETARDEERTRIAREIHDELGQSLSILQLDLTWLEMNLPEKEQAALEKIRHMITFNGKLIKEVQRISQELRPSVLDHLGFSAALAWQVQEFTRHTGIQCDFLIKSDDIKLNSEQSNSLFRVSQEALTNVLRHANAKKVSITLEEKNKEIKLIIRDDGKGITWEQIKDPNSLGLIGIRERMLALNGKISITGKPNKGTILKVSIPLKKKGVRSNENSDRR